MLNVDNLFDEEYYTDVEPFPNLTYEGLIGVGPSEIMIGTHGHPAYSRRVRPIDSDRPFDSDIVRA